MAVDAQSSLPQWIISPLVWILVFFASLITGSVGWLWRAVWLRLTTVETGIKDLELRMAPLISRTELLAHLKQMREESDQRFGILREDYQRTHQENLDSRKQLRQEIVDNGAAVRGDIRGVHARIDDVFKTIR